MDDAPDASSAGTSSEEAFHGSARTKAFLEAARAGDLPSLEIHGQAIMKDMHGSVSSIRDPEMRTALHLAARNGHTAACAYLVGVFKVRLDPKDSYGETPLFQAARCNHLQTVEYLLARGADPSSMSKATSSMLHNAAMMGNTQLMRLLLEKGANVELISNDATPLICAASRGQIDAIKLLLEFRADPNHKTSATSYDTPLSAAIAASGRSLVCFKALLQGGADLGAIAYPLHDAARCGKKDVVNYLLDTCNPDALNGDGLKPIQIGALNDKLEVVDFLLPLTSPIRYFPEWTSAAIKDQTLSKIAKDKATLKELMDADDLTDEEIMKKLEKMLLRAEDDEFLSKKGHDEDNFFSNWPPLKRRLFYKSTIPTLEKPTLVTDLYVGPIENSTIFDTSSKDVDELQANYRRAIGHYRAWHLAGSDGIYEFENSSERFCVSRKDRTFIFWYRLVSQDVGLIIDGQTLWVEGFLRRTFNIDGTFTYNDHIIQFRDETGKSDNEGKSTSKKPAIGSEEQHTYIQGSDVQVVDCGGSYKNSVTLYKLNIHLVHVSIGVISSFERHDKLSFKDTCHEASDILVLFATEAGKNSWIFQFTMESLDSTILKPIRIPNSLKGTVVKHKKISLRALAAVEKRMEKSSANNEEYRIIPGAPFRRLCQCVDAFFILARKVTFDTKFLVPEMNRDSRAPVKPHQMKGKHAGTSKATEKLTLEAILSQGTVFTYGSHEGTTVYEGDICWPMPPKPSSKTQWYHFDDLAVS